MTFHRSIDQLIVVLRGLLAFSGSASAISNRIKYENPTPVPDAIMHRGKMKGLSASGKQGPAPKGGDIVELHRSSKGDASGHWRFCQRRFP